MSEFNDELNKTENVDIEDHCESASESNQNPNAPKRNGFLKDLVDYVEIFVFALGVVILLFSFCFRICTVSGDSMQSTLFDGESVIVSDMFYSPKRGDIIVFHNNTDESRYWNDLNKPLVKRVIATEGETVYITYSGAGQSMTVTITTADNETFVYEEDYIQCIGMVPPTYDSPGEYVVPEGKIFVMGDNRNDSTDSRDIRVGFVDERTVLGKVIFRVTPFSKIGFVK